MNPLLKYPPYVITCLVSWAIGISSMAIRNCWEYQCLNKFESAALISGIVFLAALVLVSFVRVYIDRKK